MEIFWFKQKKANEMRLSLGGSERGIRERGNAIHSSTLQGIDMWKPPAASVSYTPLTLPPNREG